LAETKKYLIAIVGPTAIGKTAVSIALAKHFNSEIISADSRQFFKEMSIGTAVPSREELAKVPHHCIQHISIEDEYSVGDFERDVLQLLEEKFKKHDLFFLVGGSGLYIDAVLKGLDSFPDINPKVRAELQELFDQNGIKPLQEQLKQQDPEYYEKVDTQNPHRLIRALEVCIQSGKPYSSFLGKNKPKRPFEILKIGLEADRKVLYDRINKRVDIMMENGLIEEAKQLEGKKHLNALQTVGYKELFSFFENEISRQSAIEEIKKNSRRYAKRQLTWLRKDEEVQWFEYNETIEKIIQYIKLKTS
jgi:tRNA dimethylallyltransferase